MAKRGLVCDQGDALGPERTCVGCRGRAAKANLIRIVYDPVVASAKISSDGRGRGAYLHPDPDCLRLALRRRTLGRALRVSDPGTAVLETEFRDRLTLGL